MENLELKVGDKVRVYFGPKENEEVYLAKIHKNLSSETYEQCIFEVLEVIKGTKSDSKFMSFGRARGDPSYLRFEKV